MALTGLESFTSEYKTEQSAGQSEQSQGLTTGGRRRRSQKSKRKKSQKRKQSRKRRKSQRKRR